MNADLGSLAIGLGLVFTRPLGMLLAVGLGNFACVLIRRNSAVKVALNVANFVLGAALAILVFHTVAGSARPIDPRGWLSLCVALFVNELATMLVTFGAVWLSTGRPSRSQLDPVRLYLRIGPPLNAAVGIIVVTVVWIQPWTMVLLFGVGLALALGYRAAATMRARYNNLQLLYGFTVKLADLSGNDEVLAVGLSEARSLLRCQRSELCLVDGEEGVRVSVDGEGKLTREICEPGEVERHVLSTEKPLLVPRGRRELEWHERPFDDLMAVSVQLGDDATGAMLLKDRPGASPTFDHEDLRLFTAMAAHLGTALTSGRRLDRLRHEAAAREHEALHDALTGLANRTLFTQWVEDALARRHPSQLLAVLLMDLDGFKEINDTLGHHTGDGILKEAAARVIATVGPSRLAARLGGDEFAIVVPTAASEDEVLGLAQAVHDAVTRPLTIDSLVLAPRASVGVALAPAHGSDAATLLKSADVAMYAAKTAIRKVALYDPEVDQNTTRRLVLATELRRAIGANELEVWYQPVAQLRDGMVTGFEALLRWRHPEFGPVSPNEFIPVAEQTGLIEPLTAWVLRDALYHLRRFHDDGYPVSLAVNLSARSLLDVEIVERMRRVLAESGVKPSSLTLELTESSIMVDDRSERTLSKLAELDVNIAIDDFGTGYSSLSRLKRLPVKTVKIDRSFVNTMCSDEGNEAIVRTTIELARNMGHTVVAEGVEDRETWNRLIELGCDEAQGYFLAAALPPEECHVWLRSRQSPSIGQVRALRRPTRAAGA